jgi:hypothetical protein
MTILYVLSSLGGATAFFVAIAVVIRWLAKQVTATQDNTDAVRELTTGLTKLNDTVDSQGKDIAFLKGRLGA